MSPSISSNLPKPSAGRTIRFLFGLAPNGVYHRHNLLPVARCALTAPFHPYLYTGGILSAALSVGSRPPGVTWRSTLWSPDFPRFSSRLSNQLAATLTKRDEQRQLKNKRSLLF